MELPPIDLIIIGYTMIVKAKMFAPKIVTEL